MKALRRFPSALCVLTLMWASTSVEALAAVRWCCRETVDSLKRALRRHGLSVVMLPPLADLDRRADLERWLAHRRSGFSPSRTGAWDLLVSRLLQLLADLRQQPPTVPAPVLLAAAAHVPPLRGPPPRPVI